jgi:DNA-binding winged helix-turn-helix (wHTH) protein
MKEFGPFRLDRVNQCLWRRTGSGERERILLTPTEFGVLDHLVEHAGRLVTHRELLEAVWPETVIEPQAVKNKVFHLRRVLDDDPKQPRFIETLPRRGYRFVGRLNADVADEGRERAPTPHLVGRDGPLAELRQRLQRARAGHLEVVFITGEPGIGKTALVEEFQRQVTAGMPGIQVARGQCVEGFGGKEAFYPVLEAVGQLCRGSDGHRVIDILASHAPTWLVQLPALLTQEHRETLRQEILGATRERMLREICGALEVIARTRPLLLLLGSLHWGDASTLDLISALARGRSARLMVIATYRPSDLAGSAQPLHALKRDLVAGQLAREIVLPPLTEADIGQYLRAAASAGAPEELASLLYRQTEGNPLFVVTVLEHLIRHGLIEGESGAWRLTRAPEEIAVEVPDSLRETIEAQVEQLDESEQRVLEVGAIAGTTFAPAVIAPVADLDADAFEACCNGLALRGHVLRLGDTLALADGRIIQRYRFAHTLQREVLYERQTPAQRATRHRRLGERLEELSASALEVGSSRLALHFEKGGDWIRAIRWLRRAADDAVRRCLLEDARAHLQHALALVEYLPAASRGTVETEVLDLLADTYLGTFDPRAVETLTLLRDRAARYGLPHVEAKALVDLAYPLAWTSSERSVELIDQALRLSHGQRDPLLRARTRARCLVRRIWARGWSAEDAAECRRSLDEVRALGTEDEVAWHQVDSAVVDFWSAQYRRAQRDADAGLALLMQGRQAHPYLSFAHSLREFLVPWTGCLLGEWGAALRELDDGIALAERNIDPFRGQTLLLYRGWVLLHAMDLAGARTTCQAVWPALQGPYRTPWRRLCLALSGAAEAALGSHGAALERLQAVRDELEHPTVINDWYCRLLQRWALTNLWLAMGDLGQAREEGALLIANAGATAERTWQALAWETSARIALASGDAGLAQERIDRALGALEGFEAPVAGWQAHATAADVSRASGDPVAAARHHEASRHLVRQLAGSLRDHEAVRCAFLGNPSVARVAGEPAGA